MGQDIYFKSIQYNKRLSKYFLNTYYIDFLYKQTNFKNEFLKIRNKDTFSNFDILFQDKNMWKKGTTPKEIAENIEKIKKAQAVKNKEDIDEFLIILYNKTLIMMCTIFDTFLVDCVEVIIDNNPKTLKAFANDKDISLDDIIDIDTGDILKNIQKKCLKRFDFGGIEDKFKYLDKLGVKKEALFNFNTKMIQRFPNPESFLKEEIYEKRHLIVHKNEMNINNFEKLSKVYEYLNYLIVFWGCIVFAKHFHITSDLILNIKDK